VFFYAPGKEEFIMDKLQGLNIKAFKIDIV